MGRTRQIKYEFFLNEGLAAIDPIARLLFIGLWTICDKEGRLEYRPARIKAQLFPYHDADVAGMVEALSEYLMVYEVGGAKYIQVKKFLDHQRPHPGEKISVIPEFGDGCREIKLDFIGSNEEVPNSKSNSNPNSKVAPSPSDSEPPVLVFKAVGKQEWNLTASKVAEWTEAYPGVDVLSECRKARQWAIDNPGKNKTAKGHPAFLSRWLARVQDSGKSKLATRAPSDAEQAKINEGFKRYQEQQNSNPWADTAEAF